MKKSILIVLAMLAVVLPAGAVLKESNMEQTSSSSAASVETWNCATTSS